MTRFTMSMTNRLFLVLSIGLIAASVLAVWSALRDRQHLTHDMHIHDTAQHIEALVQALEGAGAEQKAAIFRTAQIFGLEVGPANKADSGGDADTPLIQLLKSRFADNRDIAILGQTECQPQQGKDAVLDPGRYDGCEIIYISLQDDVPLKLTLHTSSDRLTPLPLQRQASYAAVFLALIFMFTYLAAKMAAHPMKQLAAAAANLGVDIDAPMLPEHGSTEARQAAIAFNAMRARIRRQIQHRTHMLAAITHDLQTPLTRLRLRLEKVNDTDLQGKLIDDLATMQTMVRDGLDLARSMDSSEPKHLLDADSLLDSICADALDGGQNVSFTGRTASFIMVQSHALRRCLTNVIDNAVKYGHYARISAIADGGKLIIRIRDGGPGIPDIHLDAVLDPFFRLETSRSRGTGGTGIGLTIARNIAQNNDASFSLKNHEEGGLEVRLELPIRKFRASKTSQQDTAI